MTWWATLWGWHGGAVLSCCLTPPSLGFKSPPCLHVCRIYMISIHHRVSSGYYSFPPRSHTILRLNGVACRSACVSVPCTGLAPHAGLFHAIGPRPPATLTRTSSYRKMGGPALYMLLRVTAQGLEKKHQNIFFSALKKCCDFHNCFCLQGICRIMQKWMPHARPMSPRPKCLQLW